MQKGAILIISFVAGMLLTIAGALFKILHYAGADLLLIVGIITTFVFIVGALYEILSSKNINSIQKFAWTVCMLFMSGIAGLVYLLVARNKIVTTS